MNPANIKGNGPNEQSEDTTTSSQPPSSLSTPTTENTSESPPEPKAEEPSPSHKKRKGRSPTAEQRNKLSAYQKKRAAEIRLLCEYFNCDWPTAQMRYEDLKKKGKLDGVLTRAAAGQHDPLVPMERCPKCNSKLIRRDGRFGPFIGCVGYPECRFTKPVDDGNIKPSQEEMDANVAKMQLTTKFIQDIGGTEQALKWIGICIQGLTRNTGGSNEIRNQIPDASSTDGSGDTERQPAGPETTEASG